MLNKVSVYSKEEQYADSELVSLKPKSAFVLVDTVGNLVNSKRYKTGKMKWNLKVN